MGFVLMIPFLLVRFGLLSILGRGAVLRAAYFAALQKREKAAYWVYQLSTAAIFLSLFFLRIRTAPSGLYAAGIAVYAATLRSCPKTGSTKAVFTGCHAIRCI